MNCHLKNNSRYAIIELINYTLGKVYPFDGNARKSEVRTVTGKTKNAQPQQTKEQKDKRRKALIKLGSITVLTALVLLFATI